MQVSFEKNKHTATEYNSGPGYRRALKKIINFRPSALKMLKYFPD